MSACLATLDDWLDDMVMVGVLTIRQAWDMQDQVNLTPPDSERGLPEEMRPIAEAIWLHEVTDGDTLQ